MGIQIGSLTVRYYGIIIMLGAVAATWLASKEAQRKGQNPETVWDGMIWILIGGIIGARLWHILTPPPSMVEQGITVGYYLTHPLDAIAIWRGGLGVPGAVIGGILALYIYARKKHLPFLTWLDIGAPALALGQAIGRWGNYVNQELYGAPTNLPWGIFIDPIHRLPGYETDAKYHPLFFYESLWSLGNMFLLLWLSRKYGDKLPSGSLFLVYLVMYPIGRFALEFLRLDAAQVAGININQILMLVIAAASSLVIVMQYRLNRQHKRIS